MRQYGLKLSRPKGQDYIFGSSLPMTVVNPTGDWSDYLPVKEFQNLNGIETYACVTFTILNCIETLIKYKYGEDVNYSERFLASVSGTKEGGNDPQVVCEFLRKIGVVPQDLWAFDVSTFEEFYKPIPPKLYELAREFNEKWDFLHEYVPTTKEAISQALKCSPLLISVSAWYINGNGRYYRPQGMQDNHATTLFYESEGNFRRVFDSYDSPFIKDVEWDAIPMMIKRFSIEKKVINSLQTKSLWSRILAWFHSHVYNK